MTPEVVICPNCNHILKTTKTINLPDSQRVTCKECGQKFSLGQSRARVPNRQGKPSSARPPTEKQVEYAQRLGIHVRPDMDLAELSVAINARLAQDPRAKFKAHARKKKHDKAVADYLALLSPEFKSEYRKWERLETDQGLRFLVEFRRDGSTVVDILEYVNVVVEPAISSVVVRFLAPRIVSEAAGHDGHTMIYEELLNWETETAIQLDDIVKSRKLQIEEHQVAKYTAILATPTSSASVAPVAAPPLPTYVAPAPQQAQLRVAIDQTEKTGRGGFFRAFGITSGFMAAVALVVLGVPILFCGGCIGLSLMFGPSEEQLAEMRAKSKASVAAAEQSQSNEQSAEELRKARIKEHFSFWDGSHLQLTEYIKNAMDDPGSYEHVETRYGDRGEFLMVSTTFRGKNGFGALVKTTVVAKCDLDGSVMEIVSGM